jgi:glycosyltransferase involved in cell wall biosynthesis
LIRSPHGRLSTGAFLFDGVAPFVTMLQSRSSHCWHIVTGEYPPQPGGVADYTRSVAHGLAAAGDDVTVWAPTCRHDSPNDAGVIVRRLPGHFGPPALAALDRALARRPGRVILQYTPHAFGCKAMNVPLCAWLWARQRRLDVMFHEVAYPLEAGQPLKHRMLAVANRGMAVLLLRAAERVFVSTPAWSPLLEALVPWAPRPVWTPVPSNLPSACTPAAVAAVRQQRAGSARWLVGHFSTYGPLVTRLLEPALVELLTGTHDVHVVLLGHGGPAFAAALLGRRPALAGRLTATGVLDTESAAAHLAACDVVLQPYPDGICTRRSSAMAALALGRPIVATDGRFCEPIWKTAAAVQLAAPDALAPVVVALLDDAPRRAALGRHAAALYRSHFAVEHTIRAIRDVNAIAHPIVAV